MHRLLTSDGSEEELDDLLYALKSALPRAGVSDLIFWPDQERTAEQIVDEALAREQRSPDLRIVGSQRA